MFLKCPNCDEFVEIQEEEINCGIFRHATYKNMEPVNPHLPERECGELVSAGEIYGCCMPFQCIKIDNEYVLKKCDYI